MKQEVRPGTYGGTVAIPSSKSDAQRALLCAALASGTSVIRRAGMSNDERAMLETVQRLGARVEHKGDHLLITGTSAEPAELNIHVGESGLGVRLLTPVCAALTDTVTITGEGSLNQRNLSLFGEFLPQMGVKVRLSENSVPIQTQGGLRGGRYEVNGELSSQYVSGLLMALPLCEEDSELVVHNLKSGAYVQMTVATLQKFGIQIERSYDTAFFVRGPQIYQPCDYAIEADWSAASYWLVAGALGATIVSAGLSMSSLQADKAMLSLLLNAHCRIINGEEGIVVDGTKRGPIEADLTNCPDLFPALVAYAALTEGVSRLSGVHRLANKESDRGTALVSEFSKLGVSLSIDDDVLVITGSRRLTGGVVSAHGDHRIAMCLAIAGMFAAAPVCIEGAESVAKSYPGFWEDLSSLQAGR